MHFAISLLLFVIYCPITFQSCSASCSDQDLGDGFCDQMCNTTSCNYDNGDCPNTSECATGCNYNNLGDGYCDSNCNIEECSYDQGDCDDKNSHGNLEWMTESQDNTDKVKKPIASNSAICIIVAVIFGTFSGISFCLNFCKEDKYRLQLNSINQAGFQKQTFNGQNALQPNIESQSSPQDAFPQANQNYNQVQGQQPVQGNNVVYQPIVYNKDNPDAQANI